MTKTVTITTPSDREICFQRIFNAPARLVYDAWTRPELISRWLLGPDGWTMPVCEVDLRVGGAYRYVWRNADGREMGMGGVYLELDAPTRWVATEQFDDAWYPGEAVTTNELVEADGRTTHTGTVRYESKAARDIALGSGMEKGIDVSYDRLEALLAEVS